MIVHVALFSWSPTATQEQIQRFLAELRRLPSEIPGIVNLTDGRNFAEHSAGYAHGVTVQFSDRAAWEAYDPHPTHKRLVDEFLVPILGDVLEVNYEDPSLQIP